MPRRLRPVGLDFVETAPVRLVFAQEMSAPPERVFHALNDDVPGWAEWLAAVTPPPSRDQRGGRVNPPNGGGQLPQTHNPAQL
ncbi:SRPBCC family protein, partial [Streptomyces sp. NPDC059627]